MQSTSRPIYPRTYRRGGLVVALSLGMGAISFYFGARGVAAWLAAGQTTDIRISGEAVLMLLVGLFFLFGARYRVTLYETAIEVCTGLTPTRRLGRSEIAGRRLREGSRGPKEPGFVDLWPKDPSRRRIALSQALVADAYFENWIGTLPDLDAEDQRNFEAGASPGGPASADKKVWWKAGRLGLYPQSLSRRPDGFPLVTWLIIASCTAIFLYQLTLPAFEGADLEGRFGARPALILFGAWPWNTDSAVILSSLLTSMFLHAGYEHLLGNLLFFFVFSVAVELRMGSLRFVLFYLLCGVIGTLTHALFSPLSTDPLVGASGAIAGVLAAHALLLPWDRVEFRSGTSPAWAFTGAWLGLQFLTPLLEDAEHIAWLAHVGGVAAGLLLTPLFCRPGIPLFGSLPPDEAGMDGERREPWRDDRPAWLPAREVSRGSSLALATLAILLTAGVVGVTRTRNAVAGREVVSAVRIHDSDLRETWAEAQDGVPAAQMRVSLAYETDGGGAKSHTEALAWRHKAAYQGDASACYRLGLEANESGYPSDKILAYQWFSLAAEAGSKRARERLPGLAQALTAEQMSVTQNFLLAWESANDGNVPAQYAVGLMVKKGEGIERNFPAAVKWLERAAYQGHAPAQYHLGQMLQMGLGVDQDNVQALRWLLLAEAGGYADSAARAQELSASMSLAEVTEARQWAAQSSNGSNAHSP